MEQLGVGVRACETRIPPLWNDQQDDCSASYAVRDGDSSVPMIRSHVKKLEVAEIKMCRWACGHILRYRVRNDDIRETGGKVYHRTCRKARLRCSLETWRDVTKNTSAERLWRWQHMGEEDEEDRSRDGWTVSTKTWELSRQIIS